MARSMLALAKWSSGRTFRGRLAARGLGPAADQRQEDLVDDLDYDVWLRPGGGVPPMSTSMGGEVAIVFET